MPIQNMDTYHGWIAAGRQVRQGQRAEHYAKTEDGDFYALFHLDQTDEHKQIDLAACQIVSAVEREAARKGGKPRVKVKIHADHKGDSELLIWCGSNKRMIEVLKGNNYHYDARRHRWVVTRKTEAVEGILKALEYYGVDVEVESDNRGEAMI